MSNNIKFKKFYSTNDFCHYVYKTINKVNNRFYIGAHSGTINDWYLGSGKALMNAVEKYGRDNFKKEILYIFDNHEDMYLKEREIVNHEFIKDRSNYNIRLGGSGGGFWKLLDGIPVGLTTGQSHYRNIKTGNIEILNTDDPRIGTEYLHRDSGKNIHINIKTEEFKMLSSDDELVVSGEYVPFSKYLILMNNGIINISVKPYEVEKYLSNGWVRGRFVEIVKCKYCDYEGRQSEVTRLHDDFCYYKDKIQIFNEEYNLIKWITTSEEIEDGWSTTPFELRFRLSGNGSKMIEKVCPHCKTRGYGANMSRCHFDKCKHRGL